MANRIVKLDALALPDHYYLDGQDECYYSGEYTAGEGHAYSATNQLIFNFKKSVDKRGTAQWRYKEMAIQQAANIFKAAIKSDAQITFVPIPPSMAKSDPLYDDRMLRLLQSMGVGRQIDIRELVLQRQSTEAAHLAMRRPTPEELIRNYMIDETVALPIPELIFVVDDVLTTGSHYKAMKHVLLSRFRDAQIIGLFIARRVPKSVDISAIFNGAL